VAGVAQAGYWNSIALSNNGTVGIAFEDVTTGAADRVRLATCATNCGNAATATWNLATVATPAANGNFFPSLQYDALNLAHITFIDAGATTLRYAIQTAAGAASFQFFDIDHQVDDGHSSFILTPLGSTHVSYSLTTGLKYYPFGD
jgi:hypothetical protein